MHPETEMGLNLTRRRFFGQGAHPLGYAALASLLGGRASAANSIDGGGVTPHFPAKCKNIIYLHMVGGPPQMDLYDYKPKMKDFYAMFTHHIVTMVLISFSYAMK